MKTIAIIGASGEVGYRLVKALSASWQVTCVVRNVNKRDFSVIKNTRVCTVTDAENTAELAKAITGAYVVINASYIWFAQSIWQAIEMNTAKPEQVILTGSTGVLTKLPSESANKKREAEAYIAKKYTVPYTIIRPTMIYGHANDLNISRLARVLKKTPVFPLIGKGNSLVQPVFIYDVVEALKRAILNEHCYQKSFNIGAAQPITNKVLFAEVARAVNRKPWLLSINTGFVRLIIGLLLVLKVSPIKKEQVLRFQEDKSIDLKPFIEAFCFTPRTFGEGLNEMFEITA